MTLHQLLMILAFFGGKVNLNQTKSIGGLSTRNEHKGFSFT